MIDIYVLDGNLETVGIVNGFTSLIWANRYNTVGDCDLYVPATIENLDLLKKDNYLMRKDDDMICRIEKVELETDVENGDYLAITGYDVKKILQQRIIWSQTNVDGNVEDYIRDLITKSLVNPALSARQVRNTRGEPIFFLGDKAGFTEVTTEQATYKQISEKIEELCQRYEWGYKVIQDSGKFYFCLYAGEDRSDTVIFSPDFENLVSTLYQEDNTNLANVALVGGEGEGSQRARNVSGYAESLKRNEIFVDAKDISRTISWSELIEMYPTTDKGGHGSITGSATAGFTYTMDIIDISIVDNNQLSQLKTSYPQGQEITKEGNKYYQIYNAIIADLPSDKPSESDPVVLRDVVYSVYLLTRGYEKLAEYGSVVSFEGSVSPDVTFVYKQDYFLGDKVSVKNEYGIEAVARIVEVIEVYDENGYNVSPRFEYVSLENNTRYVRYLLQENSGKILTEDQTPLLVEENPESEIATIAETPDIEFSGKKISELPESTELYDGCCMPVVTYGETKKLTYELLKQRLYEDLDSLFIERDKKKKPVGSLEFNTSGQNPATYLGFGTWVQWGAGRVPVGIDPAQAEFATVEKEGGEKTHALTVAELAAHAHSMAHTHGMAHTHNPPNAGYHFSLNKPISTEAVGRIKVTPNTSGKYHVLSSTNIDDIIGATATGASSAANTGAASAANTGNNGSGTAHNNLQPYITCYIWKRTE